MKNKILILIFIVLMCVGGYFYFNNKNNLKSNFPNSNIKFNTTKTVTIFDKYKDIKINTWSADDMYSQNNYSISFPATSNDKINKTLENYSQEFLNEFEKSAKEFSDNATDETIAGVTFAQHFEVFMNSDNYVGFLIDRDRNYGNDSEISYKTFIFNKKTGENVGVDSIFKDKSYLAYLSKISREKLNKDLQKEVSDNLDGSTQQAIDEYKQNRIEEINKGTEPTIENFSNLEFSTTSVTVKFNKFQVGPGSVGTPSVDINLSDIAPYIKSEFLSAIQGSDKSTTVEVKVKAPAEPIKVNQNNVVPVEQPKVPTTSVSATSPTTTTPIAVATPTQAVVTQAQTYTQPAGSVNCKVEKCVALTFDDGPSVHTDKLLDILDQKNVKATFFLIGRSVKIQAPTIARMYASGHQIGNHTWDHPDLRKLGADAIKSQISRTDDAISSVTTIRPTTIRTPYGVNTPAVRAVIDRPIILWNVDSKDWSSKNTASIVKELEGAKPGSILLSHDIYAQTVAAIPAVIDDYRAKGYKFVTVSELYGGQQLQGGKAYFGF